MPPTAVCSCRGCGRRGRAPVDVIVPDLPENLPWTMVDGVKEFHLYCGHTRREFLPGVHIDVWGFNGSMPGPSIEVNQGDRVRIWVHNQLPESTGIHWHGLEIPVAMDGVPGLTQPPLAPGQSQAFEFTLAPDRHLLLPLARRYAGRNGHGRPLHHSAPRCPRSAGRSRLRA